MKKLLLVAGLLAVASPLAAQTPEEVARAALAAAPVWDGHNDVPIQLRARFGNVIEDFDFADTSEVVDEEGQHMHTDLARLGEGMVGAQFWSVYVSAALPEPEAVVATVEQIDVARRLIAKYPDRLALALTADDVQRAMDGGKIASLTWLRSTSMPSRCISRTTCSPNSVRPLCCGSTDELSAQAVFLLWVSVM